MIQEVTPDCLAPNADLLNTTWHIPSQNFLCADLPSMVHFAWVGITSHLAETKVFVKWGGNISVPSLRVWFLLTAGSEALVTPCLKSGFIKRMLSSDGCLLTHSGLQLVQQCCPRSGLVFSSHRCPELYLLLFYSLDLVWLHHMSFRHRRT